LSLSLRKNWITKNWLIELCGFKERSMKIICRFKKSGTFFSFSIDTFRLLSTLKSLLGLIIKMAKSKFKNVFSSFDSCICGSSIVSRFCNIPAFWLPVIQIVHAFVDGQLIFGFD
jgi:hypothetical protein